MKCNHPVFLFVLVAGVSSCSVKDLNLPQASPMPVKKTTCPVRFETNMKLHEIAFTAREMQQVCGFKETLILELARID